MCRVTQLTPLNTRWRSWLRHRATSRKVAGSIPDVVTGIFHSHTLSKHITKRSLHSSGILGGVGWWLVTGVSAVQEANLTYQQNSHTEFCNLKLSQWRHYQFTRRLTTGFDPAISLILTVKEVLQSKGRFVSMPLLVRTRSSTILALLQALKANEENGLG